MDLQAIKERVAAATEGPWFWDESRNDYLLRSQHNHDVEEGYFGKEIIEATCSHNFGVVSIEDEDANFIAHARQDVPALVAEVERLQKELQEAAEYGNYKNDLAMQNLRSLNEAHDEIERLREALEQISDLEVFDGKSREHYQSLAAQAFCIACKALEGGDKG